MFQNKSLFMRLLIHFLILLFAAAICLLGSLLLILKSPYDSYRTYCVRQICSKTRFDFAVKWIIGEEEMQKIIGNTEVKENAQ